MKKLLCLAFLCMVSFAHAQAFKAKADRKFQIGANFQNNATGINGAFDVGVGENLSLGISSSYLLNVDQALEPDFQDRFDVKFRINANLSSVIVISDYVDIYPGLDLSLKNFGFHVGCRYFFTDGFGLYAEAGFPLAIYDSGRLTAEEKLHNQFALNVGATFNL